MYAVMWRGGLLGNEKHRRNRSNNSFFVDLYTGVVQLFSGGLPLTSCFGHSQEQEAFPMSNFSLVPSMRLKPSQAQSQQGVPTH